MTKTETPLRRNATLHTVLVALALAGCGGGTAAAPGAAYAGSEGQSGDAPSGPVGAVHQTGSGTVSAVVGPAGGSLEISNGPRIEIPVGALEEPVEFVLKKAPLTTAFYNEESERPSGPTFVFSPEVFAPDGGAITVSMPMASYPDGWGEVALAYEYAEGSRAHAEDSTHTRWQYEPGKLSGGRAVVEMEGLAGHRLQFVLTNLESQ